ncbi:MAG: beta-ketoacyl synthase N-terminal-like domain-containing protein [Phycisphaerae bacterium]|nr:beta-ketoacyl synthase N-terminal-like domain-containing protein [Phycisphaerae bacterium]
MALAADEAVRAAGWPSETLSDEATGLCAATSKGDIAAMTASGRQPADFLKCLPDGPGNRLAERLAIRGPRVTSVAACATGTHALIRAAQMLRDGDADRVLVSVADASITPLLLGAFARMGVLTADACRPFDVGRSGFFISEGAAAVTIERADAAAAPPLVELAGWLTGADPTGLIAQDVTGGTLGDAIRILLSRAKLSPRDVTLYSAHGTATASNDRAEAAAIGDSLRANGSPGPWVFAAKSMVGHLLGAASLTEAIVAIEAVVRGVCPPTPTLCRLDPRCNVAIGSVAHEAHHRAAICTSLGFGGQMGLLAFRRV